MNKMVDSKEIKISPREIIKDPELLGHFPDYLKTKIYVSIQLKCHRS